MSWIVIFGALEIGLIFSIVALGVFITFKLMKFPDLTVEGSFMMGGAAAAAWIEGGGNPWIGLVCSLISGAACGLMTAWLHAKWGIAPLLASILTMLGSYSVNLRIMGKPNAPLLGEPTIFAQFETLTSLPNYMTTPLFLIIAVLIIKLLLDRLLVSQKGLAFRAAGANERVARAQGVDTRRAVYVGMAGSNALCGLAGGLFAQSQGGADISMGSGVVIVGLAAVIIGDRLLLSRNIFVMTLGCIVGAILYRFLVALALDLHWLGLRAQDLNLVTAILVALALALPGKRFSTSVRT